MKKYIAEFFGTMIFILMGCCAAVYPNYDVNIASGFGSAIAFGLAVVFVLLAPPLPSEKASGRNLDGRRSLSPPKHHRHPAPGNGGVTDVRRLSPYQAAGELVRPPRPLDDLVSGGASRRRAFAVSRLAPRGRAPAGHPKNAPAHTAGGRDAHGSLDSV